MSNSTAQQPRQVGAARPRGLPFEGQPSPDGAFWCGAIGAGACIMVELAFHVDLLSRAIVRLPETSAVARPAVTRYLATVKTLASNWSRHTRPALLEAVEALTHVGASLARPFTMEALANRRVDGGQAATRVVQALLRRMGAPAASLQMLAADLDEQLGNMAGATRELESDTLLLSERLQADHVHTFLLSQQASTLQSKLDDATMRQDAYWLQGPHAEQIRQEIALHRSALEGVRRQLDYLQAEQASNRGEAHYLQNLMPSLSGYLNALERMAGGIRAAQAGAASMLYELHELKRVLAEEPNGVGPVEAQLRTALTQWRALAASADRLRPGQANAPAGARQGARKRR
ncbi:hypothetical protein [Massilia sp. TSP1-1-2]|uniref:hypothetical protein n=1 Tax=Massilia sp. TSP1-1-2 TaxID=2804649 RepID=UPI003CEB7D3B